MKKIYFITKYFVYCSGMINKALFDLKGEVGKVAAGCRHDSRQDGGATV
jgi:hypothetical protein